MSILYTPAKMHPHYEPAKLAGDSSALDLVHGTRRFAKSVEKTGTRIAQIGQWVALAISGVTVQRVAQAVFEPPVEIEVTEVEAEEEIEAAEIEPIAAEDEFTVQDVIDQLSDRQKAAGAEIIQNFQAGEITFKEAVTLAEVELGNTLDYFLDAVDVDQRLDEVIEQALPPSALPEDAALEDLPDGLPIPDDLPDIGDFPVELPNDEEPPVTEDPEPPVAEESDPPVDDPVMEEPDPEPEPEFAPTIERKVAFDGLTWTVTVNYADADGDLITPASETFTFEVADMLGDATVTLYAEDSKGNTASETLTIPQLVAQEGVDAGPVPLGASFEVNEHSQATFEVQAFDVEDGLITSEIAVDNANFEEAAEIVLRGFFEDSAGNTAEADYAVQVLDIDERIRLVERTPMADFTYVWGFDDGLGSDFDYQFIPRGSFSAANREIDNDFVTGFGFGSFFLIVTAESTGAKTTYRLGIDNDGMGPANQNNAVELSALEYAA